MAAIDGPAGPSMATKSAMDGPAGPVVAGDHLQRNRPSLRKSTISAHIVFREILISNIECTILLFWHNTVMSGILYHR